MAEPLDFELEIGSAVDAQYPVAARVKDGGEASGTMAWSMTGRELDARLAAIRDSVLASSVLVRRLSTLDEQPVRDFGQTLFDAAMNDQVRLLYVSAYQQSRQQDRPLRIVLRIRPPELTRLPWEFMFDRSNDTYLGLRMPLVRFPQVFEPQRPLKVVPPLNILAMVARPADQATLDVEGEKSRLTTALAELERAGQVKLTWVQGQSWRDLRTMLDRGAWHVFHFIGHGGFDAQSGEGVLALAGEVGGTSPLGASALSLVLSDSFALRLVVLNACDTGRSSALDSFSSVAGALVRRGIPAILAMQFEITDRAAIEFTRTFYEELAHRRPVDAGVVRARQAIYIAQSNSLEWGTPVLYLRSNDGEIFEFSEHESDAPVAAPEERERAETDRLRGLYAEGSSAFFAERWDEAAGVFREVLAQQPDYPGASLKLEQAVTKASVVTAYVEASKAAEELRWQDAVDGFEAVLALDPAYRDARQRLDEGRTRKLVADLQDELWRLFDAQQWEAVVRHGERLGAIDRNSADPDGIVTQAQRLLQRAEQKRVQAERDRIAREQRETETIRPPPRRGYKSLLAVIAIVAVGALILGDLVVVGVVPNPFSPHGTPTPTAVPTPPTALRKVLNVPGTQTWTDTGLDVKAGERLTIQATGEVHHNPVDPAVDPEGDRRAGFGISVMPNAAHAALIARIGDSQGPYLVGQGWVRNVQNGGRLFLGVNDKGVQDNSGYFTATILGLSPAPGTPSPPPGTVVKTVSVPGTRAWTDTGIDVTTGQVITVMATGQVHHNSTDPAVGPDGDPRSTKFGTSVLQYVAHAALLGKIGDGGAPYRVGSASIRTAESGGRLFLGVNDAGVENNSGEFTAQVQVAKQPK